MNLRAAENTICLSDPNTADRYLEELALCIEQARLNDSYPKAEAVLSSLDMMAPEMHCNLYPTLTVHGATGMPTYKEFVRVSVDRARAEEELPALEKWKGRAGADIYEVLARKHRYYAALMTADEPLMESGKIFFRKIDKESSTALFRIVLDRITLTGVLERLTVCLGQQKPVWGRGAVTRDDMDAARMSESLQGMVYRMAAQDVEMIFIRLNEDPDICVETVTKGLIGPFLTELICPEPAFLPLHRLAGKGAILNLSLSSASSAQATDIFNDPYQQAPKFSSAARMEMAARRMTTYRVLTDRKFVLWGVSPDALTEHLREFGTTNIVYEAVYE